LTQRKGRTAMACAAVFVGVLGVVILFSLSGIVTAKLQEDFDAEEVAMLQVSLALPGEEEPDNAAVIRMLEGLEGVENVEGEIDLSLISWKRPGADKFEDGFINAVWEPFDQVRIEPVRLLQGRFPFTGQKEIVIEKRMANQEGLKVGDQLVLRIVSGDAPQEETWTVVGTVFNPYGIGGPPGLDPNEVSLFATYEDAVHIGGFPGLNQLQVRYIDYNTTNQQADRFVAAVDQETPYMTFTKVLNDPAINEAFEESTQMLGILQMLGMIALIVSSFLVINIVNTVVGEQRQQIGVMKSLGATRLDNILMYIGIALAYGVVGTVTGVLLGVPLGSVAAAKMGGLVGGTLIEGFNVSPAGITMGIVMGLLVPPLAALLPVILGTRVTILQAMTDLGIAVDYGRGILARLIRRLPLPINVRQGLSNVTRKKGRLFLTWVTLTLAVGMFMGIFGLFYSMNDLIAGIFDSFAYEIMVNMSPDEDHEQVQALILDEVDGVKAVYPSTFLYFDIEGFIASETGEPAPLQVLGFDPRGDSVLLDLEAGTAWQADPDRKGIVLAKTAADTLEKTAGDKLVFAVGGRPFETEIIGVTSLPMDFAFMNWQELAEIGEFLTGTTDPSTLLVQLSQSDPNVDEVDEVIDQVEETLVAQGIGAAFQNWVLYSDVISQAIQLFMMIFLIAVFAMAAVGAIGVLATLSMAVFERQKEIGVMRSIGASSWTIVGQFLVEGNLIGILAWIAGLPLAVPGGGPGRHHRHLYRRQPVAVPQRRAQDGVGDH
jgi:putative ABC transport system permease protein